jgi:hypothetical protein
MPELTEDQVGRLKRIRRWFYATLLIAVAFVVPILLRPDSAWSLAALTAIVPLGMYLNSFKCPRCGNHFFFREMGASLISPACAFCGLEMRAAKYHQSDQSEEISRRPLKR